MSYSYPSFSRLDLPAEFKCVSACNAATQSVVSHACDSEVGPYALYAYHEAFGEGTRGRTVSVHGARAEGQLRQACAKSRRSPAFPCCSFQAAVAATNKCVTCSAAPLSCALHLTKASGVKARSLASEAAKQHNGASPGSTRVLDWYTFDFQEELSGLDGERHC